MRLHVGTVRVVYAVDVVEAEAARSSGRALEGSDGGGTQLQIMRLAVAG